MDAETLFPMPEIPKQGAVPEEVKPALGTARLHCAQRHQWQWEPMELDSLLEPEHRARAVWAFVERIELKDLYAQIGAREGHAGRPAIDPKILLALWIYAITEGVGSARELADLCTRHTAYRWLCGGVGTNYHTLADFRTGQQQILDDLLTQSIGVLLHAGVVELKRAAQDGVRVRASAGADTFRRKKTLAKCLVEARQEVQRLSGELEVEPGALSRSQKAARKRAARERQERLEEALRAWEKVAAPRKASEQEEVRISTTDPEARVMKMGDGGFRPAYNVQFATDLKSQVVVGVSVSNVGSDKGQMTPMVEQIERRTGQAPEEYLVDGGYATIEDLEQVTAAPHGCVVYAPLQKPKKEGVDVHAPHKGDSEVVAEWRKRMGTEEAKTIYKERAREECVNAQARNRGLVQLPVRGADKALSIALWFGLAQNFMRILALGVLDSGP
jgi:transposase